MNLVSRLLRRLPRSGLPSPARHYSANTQIRPRPASPPSAISPVRKQLIAEIMRTGSPSSSMTAVLDRWVERGNSVEGSGSFLFAIVKELRKHRRFTHALQTLEWITKDGNHELTSSELAVRLDLIAKVRGLEDARKYFEGIPETLRSIQVYSSLLNCYAYKNSLEEAESILQKMRELGFATTLLPYNSLLTAYARAGKFAEMDLLLKEMDDKGIEWDVYTYNIRMNAYVAASEFDGLENLLVKMELDPRFTMKWKSLIVPATGFLKSGQIDKALLTLKRVENLAGNDQNAFQFLVTFYASLGKKDDVYRLWEKYCRGGKFRNNNYLSMISSLIKVDDMAGAERIKDEWDKGRTIFDIRIPNLIIAAFTERGWFVKAEAYINQLMQIGMEPKSSMWYIMARGYHSGNEMDKAVEALKKALESGSTKWEPNPALLTACANHLREKGDGKSAEDLLTYLRNRSPSPGYTENDPSGH